MVLKKISAGMAEQPSDRDACRAIRAHGCLKCSCGGLAWGGTNRAGKAFISRFKRVFEWQGKTTNSAGSWHKLANLANCSSQAVPFVVRSLFVPFIPGCPVRSVRSSGSRRLAIRRVRRICRLGKPDFRESLALRCGRFRGRGCGQPCGLWKSGGKSARPSCLL